MNSLFSVDYISEPLLRFGYNQCLDDPKDGLALFGPLLDRKPASMRVGVIGTPNGLDRYRQWVKAITHFIPSPDPSSLHQTAFPGFEAVFRTPWPEAPVVEIPLAPLDIWRSLRLSDRHAAIFETVSLYADPICRRLSDDDLGVDIWFVVIPDEVYLLGRPKSRVARKDQIDSGRRLNAKIGRSFLKQPSLFKEDMDEAVVYNYSVDFHHQLKARLLDRRVVVQVIRESSLGELGGAPPTRRLQDASTVAWNLCTASFFKAGGRPWQLAEVRPGVCYVGLIFKKDQSRPDAGNACCGAQLFLNSGEGLVFKGLPGDWYSPDSKEFHLNRSESERIVRMVVSSYKDLHGHAPAELFIHGRTWFSNDEWEGFRAATPAETKLICIRINRSNELRLYRPGSRPIIRGSAYFATSRRAFLWTAGYVPKLRTYPGREVPNPLVVEIVRGDADIRTVIADVLALTKVNFNACIYGDGLPVTLRFAEAIGEILTAGGNSIQKPLPFRHYI